MLDKRGARHGRRRAARFKSSSAQASAGGGGALTWWTSLPSVVLRRSLKRRATVRVRFYVAVFAASTTLRWASTSTSTSSSSINFTVLGVDPYLGVGSISDSLSCPPTHISIPGYLRHSVISRYRRFHTEIPVARKIVDGPPILPTNFVGAQCCCQLALGVKWERFLTRRNIGRARSSS